MEKNIKENAGFYAMGIIAVIIAVLGITANTVYAHSGGYALGVGLVAIAFLFECFIFGISPKIVKTRTKGILFFTSYILTIYTILFIFGDLAKVKVYKSLYSGGVYVSKLQPLGVFALVFEVSCLILTVFFVARMILNLFGKEFKFYEKMLGTTVVRYQERDVLEIDVPPKDTDKLVASAKKALGHDEKLENAIENAKPESNQKIKTPEIRNAIGNKNLKDETNIPKKNINDLETSVPLTSGKAEYQTSESEINDGYYDFESADETVSLAEKLFMGNENDIPTDDETEREKYTEETTKIDNGNDPICFEMQSESNENVVAADSEIEVDDTQADNESENELQVDVENYEENETGELYADTHDVGEVLSDKEFHEDIRRDGISNRITDQVENPDDYIYGMFDYDTDTDDE